MPNFVKSNFRDFEIFQDGGCRHLGFLNSLNFIARWGSLQTADMPHWFTCHNLDSENLDSQNPLTLTQTLKTRNRGAVAGADGVGSPHSVGAYGTSIAHLQRSLDAYGVSAPECPCAKNSAGAHVPIRHYSTLCVYRVYGFRVIASYLSEVTDFSGAPVEVDPVRIALRSLASEN